MISFQYSRAGNVAEAVRLIAESPGAKFVAGGTNLVDLMKMDVEQPTRLIDISRLPLDKVEETAGGGLRIVGTEADGVLAVQLRRYVGPGALLVDERSDPVGIVATIRQHHRPRAQSG
jgi:hypothetical protein